MKQVINEITHIETELERSIPMSVQVNSNIAKVVHTGYAKRRSMSCKAHNKEEVSMKKKTTNFYEVLCLESEKVGIGEIRKAYRRMALRYHPDVCVDPSAKPDSTTRFIELRKAYDTLCDPVSRRLHDYELGFMDSISIRSKFPKHVWQTQLSGLQQRCRLRMQRKNTKSDFTH